MLPVRLHGDAAAAPPLYADGKVYFFVMGRRRWWRRGANLRSLRRISRMTLGAVYRVEE
jgi:hypothetical protein